MSSRSQRFGPKIDGWRTNRRPPQPPTAADLASSVYFVLTEDPRSHTRLEFPVLALDEAHARQVGQVRLVERYHDETSVVTSLRRSETHHIAFVLGIEDVGEWQDRQAVYQARTDGEPRSLWESGR